MNVAEVPGRPAGAAAATPAQLAAVNNQFWYLGYRRSDRAKRLAACAALLGLDSLASTKDLTAGQAGQLVRRLGEFHSRAEIDEAVRAGEGLTSPPAQVPGWAVGVLLAWAVMRSYRAAASGNR